MTRQQYITREQVRARRADAERRVHDAMRACTEATTAAEYSEAVRAGVKAASDYQKWNQTLMGLTALARA